MNPSPLPSSNLQPAATSSKAAGISPSRLNVEQSTAGLRGVIRLENGEYLICGSLWGDLLLDLAPTCSPKAFLKRVSKNKRYKLETNIVLE